MIVWFANCYIGKKFNQDFVDLARMKYVLAFNLINVDLTYSVDSDDDAIYHFFCSLKTNLFNDLYEELSSTP